MKQIETNPTAKIAVKKNVLKQYRVDNTDVVYLPKDAEFEIELFNPLRETILAKIDLNNNISSGEGLILRPGERVFLERYLDVDRKFKFDVYSVDKSTASTNAIANNGLVTVKFYKEQPIEISYNDMRVRGSNIILGNPSNSIGPSFYSSPTSIFTYCSSSEQTKDSIDTGIIEKGSKSDQSFIEANQKFNYFPFYTSNIKLLPDTNKIMTTEDIKHRKYCSECGSKIRSTDKFCSNCGDKL